MSHLSRKWGLWVVMALAGALAVVAGLMTGEGDVFDPNLGGVFVRVRAIRLINSALAGSALAVGGVLVQGIFQNPLASPSILGTTAGASLGGMVVLLLWGSLVGTTWIAPELLLPLGCFAGALMALVLLLAIVGGRSGGLAVLLTGFLLSALFLSLGGLVTSMGQEKYALGRSIVAFTLGGVENKGAQHAMMVLPLVGVGFAAAMAWGRHLDALLSGEDEAATLGVDVALVRRWIIVWVATLTAGAVAIGGNVSFVGLVVPHVLRPFVGVSHRLLLPAALVGGGTFVAWCDVLTRVLPSQGQVPLGVVTSLVGAPIFLGLLVRASRRGRLA